jgi:hypothetical protein
MKDTFSKLHHDFDLSEEEDDEGTSHSNANDEERKKRRSIGLKMLMSRESSFGMNGFKSDDYQSQVNMKSLGDDSEYNKQLEHINQNKRKFGLGVDSDDEY